MEEKRVLALGFFDGAHNGHRELFKTVKKRASELSAIPAAVSFDAEPLSVITGAKVPLINTPHDRAAIIRRVDCIKEVIFLHFDRETMNMTWENFIEWLVNGFGAVHLVIGYDFSCGKGGEGKPPLIVEKCREMGIGIDVIPEYRLEGIRISSTYIRELLAEGNIPRANMFLGHPHVFSGEVQNGYRFGRTMGVPTINMTFDPSVVFLPKGVYATKSVVPDGRIFRSMTYIGTRPSAESRGDTWVETHLDGFSGDLYGQRVWIEFYRYMRPEMKFDTHEALKTRIETDLREIREFFDNFDSQDKKA